MAVPGRCVGTAACPLSCLGVPSSGSSGHRDEEGEQVRGGQPSPLPSVIHSLQECAGVLRHFILNLSQMLCTFRQFLYLPSVLELVAGLVCSAVVQGKSQKGFLSVK